MEQEKGEVETIRKFTYLGDRVSAVGWSCCDCKNKWVKYREFESCCMAEDFLYN